MFKIRYLILLFSILFFISCSLKLEDRIEMKKEKYSLSYLSGDQKGFVFKNILRQQLIVNNLFDEQSKKTIKISLDTSSEYLATTITKTSSRKSNKLSIGAIIYDIEKENCLLFSNTYEIEQSFLLAETSAGLSNTAAEGDIFIINSENISQLIIDELLLNQFESCKIVE